jgi:hypothetical protein
MDEIDKNAFPRGHQHQINWRHDPNLSKPSFLDYKLRKLNMELADRLALEETQKLLKILADNLTDKTKIEKLPPKTKRILKVIVRDTQPYFPEFGEVDRVIIQLQRFFGMLVAYHKESDTLFISDLIEENKNGHQEAT